MRLFFLILLSLPLLAFVVTQKIEKGSLTQTQNFNGTLRFNEQSRLASESDGVITRLYFDEGNYVKKGTLLLEIDTQILSADITAIQASIKEVEFALEKAKLEFKRYEILLAKQSVSQQKHDEFYFQKMQLEQRLLSLKATLKARQIAKSKKSIYAPFNGYIGERKVQVGEWLKEGSEIALLINPAKIDILIHLPSSYISTIYKDKTVEVTINNRTYSAKVIGALFSGNEKTRTFPMKLRLLETKERFFDGMQASLSIQKESSQGALFISRDGVIKRFGKDVLFIIKDKKAQMVDVQVIGYQGERVAISSDNIKEGDEVVIKGNERLFPNQEVK